MVCNTLVSLLQLTKDAVRSLRSQGVAIDDYIESQQNLMEAQGGPCWQILRMFCGIQNRAQSSKCNATSVMQHNFHCTHPGEICSTFFQASLILFWGQMHYLPSPHSRFFFCAFSVFPPNLELYETIRLVCGTKSGLKAHQNVFSRVLKMLKVHKMIRIVC